MGRKTGIAMMLPFVCIVGGLCVFIPGFAMDVLAFILAISVVASLILAVIGVAVLIAREPPS